MVKATTVFPVSCISILYPANTTYSPSPLLLSVSSVGLGGCNIYYSMSYSVDGKGSVSIPLVTQSHEMSFQVTISGSSILPELPEGPHNVTVYETIQVDTSSPFTQCDNNTVCFTVDDGNPPIITNLSPENKTYSQNDLPLNFTIDEPTKWIGYCLDGQDNVTIAGNTTLTGLPYKEHNVTVYAQDLAGNIGASETIRFNLSQPKPLPESFPTATIAIGFGVAFVIVGLLVYIKKRRK